MLARINKDRKHTQFTPGLRKRKLACGADKSGVVMTNSASEFPFKVSCTYFLKHSTFNSVIV